MQYADWGERAARWSGIHSATKDVHGMKVHYLATDAARKPQGQAHVHLFVQNPVNSASNWLDVLAQLQSHGHAHAHAHAHAIAVDLPGTIAGGTALPEQRAARIEAQVTFLRDFIDAVGLQRVTLHGWSAGGMIALLFADQAPERIDGLVLVAPALPPPVSDSEARMWRTVGAAALATLAPPARALLRVSARPLLAAKLRRTAADPASFVGATVSPELALLMRDEMAAAPPARFGNAVTVYASVTSWLFVRRRMVLDAMRRVAAPTLLVWGDEDRICARAAIDDWSAQRPDWTLAVLQGVGHAPPFEAPADYARATLDWCGSRAAHR
jgi:pimeloyl-ACP methyl ester carboxylesterase